jgi:alginate O-acetyltransferase complex protein AlgJ
MPNVWSAQYNVVESGEVWRIRVERPLDQVEEGPVDLRGWCVFKTADTSIAIVDRDGKELSISQKIPRPDVQQTFAGQAPDDLLLLSGFEAKIHAEDAPLKLFYWSGDQRAQFGEISVKPMDAAALEGDDEYLFLHNDTNKSVEQHKGEVVASAKSLAAWRQNFALMKGWEREFGCKTAMLVAPSKEEVLPEKYPFKRGRPTTIDAFLEVAKGHPLVFPRTALKRQRNLSYSRIDTHWTDYGAVTAAREVLKWWQLPDAELPNRFLVKQEIGDLGSKMAPARSEHILFMDFPAKDHLVFTNGVRNNGNITVYENESSTVDKSLLVCGDSFGTNLAAALVAAFRHVTFIYKPGSFDADLATILKPDYVLLQITQRFLIGEPNLGQSVFDIAARKLLASEGDALPFDKMVRAPAAKLEQLHGIVEATRRAFDTLVAAIDGDAQL